jgi:anti-sigma regulatory factor (Ser/Thr protein kinase)
VFALRCPAHAGNLRGFRTGIALWLTAWDWPEDDRDDVVLAASEAVANVIDHAYSTGPPGEVDVVGRLHATDVGRHVVLLVRDWGHWRPPSHDSGYRGHGLTVMRECMNRMGIDHGPQGTTVTLTSPVVPLLASSARLRSHPSLRRRPPAVGVTASAVDRVTGERRHRQAAIERRAEQLRAEAVWLSGNAKAARGRAKDTIRASRELCDGIGRRRAARRHATEAA